MWMVYLLATQWIEGEFLQVGLEVNSVLFSNQIDKKKKKKIFEIKSDKKEKL